MSLQIPTFRLVNNLREMGLPSLLPRAAFFVAVSVATGMTIHAASDPVLNLLISKGIVSEEEARKAETEVEQLRTNNAALPADSSKWRINNAFKYVELFGDARVRYENRSVQDPAGGRINLERPRYALRLGLRGEVFDNFYYGLRIETSSNPRSTWATFGSPSSAPFGKSTAGVGIGQIYLGARPTSWADLTVGKMPNPFYTTSMVWDGDLNPEGLAERFKYTVGEVDLFANFGQFIYQDTNPNEASRGYFNLNYNTANLPFLIGWQGGVNYHITPKTSFKVAPVLYNYTGRGANNGGNITSPDFSGTFIGQGSSFGVSGNPAYYNLGSYNGFFSNQTGVNSLLVLDIPWELNIKLNALSLRLFGDYAINLRGRNRADDAFAAQKSPLFEGTGIILIPSSQTKDTKAYQFGVAIGNKDSLGLVTGSTSKKHAWEFRTYWQHVEQYALDPNLLDSDFFEGRGNLQGIYVGLAYGLTDNIIGTVRYGHAERINSKLGTGGSNLDIPQLNPIKQYELIQLDLSVKF